MTDFESHFKIQRTDADDWFNPDLKLDTKLFIDPYFLWTEPSDKASIWNGAHDELIKHFAHCYRLLAKSATPGTLSHKSALSLLRFPEPHELGLGYTAKGRKGAGGGKGRAVQISNAIVVALAAGIKEPSHIEEIGMLVEGIGADGISDATANILKSRIIAYTKSVATRHNIPTISSQIVHSEVNIQTGRWVTRTHELPATPGGEPILLIPERFLGELPTLNADDWFDSHLNSDLRQQMNVNTSAEVQKQDIVTQAKRHPIRIEKWANHIKAKGLATPYDLKKDPLGLVLWRNAVTHASTHPLGIASVTTEAELISFVKLVVEEFKHYVEKERGWRNFWNDDGTIKPEEAIQPSLLGLSRGYCNAAGVEVDREVEVGRGPVDFKFSTSPTVRLLLGVKKLENGSFWNGLKAQLPIYMNSKKCRAGFLLAVQFSSTNAMLTRRSTLPRETTKIAKANGWDVFAITIDARPKVSASRAKSP